MKNSSSEIGWLITDSDIKLNDILNANVKYTVADFFYNLDDDSQIEIPRIICDLALTSDAFFKLSNDVYFSKDEIEAIRNRLCTG